MIRKELPSGNYLDVTPLPYEQAWDVAQSLLGEVQKLDVNLKGIDLEQLLVTDVVALKGPICGLLASPVVRNAVKLCFSRCCYNQVKIDLDTFEPVERRGDYLFCAFHALRENVVPFFGSLVSLLKAN